MEESMQILTEEEKEKWIAERAHYLSQAPDADPDDHLSHRLSAEADFMRLLETSGLVGAFSKLSLSSDADDTEAVHQFIRIIEEYWGYSHRVGPTFRQLSRPLVEDASGDPYSPGLYKRPEEVTKRVFRVPNYESIFEKHIQPPGGITGPNISLWEMLQSANVAIGIACAAGGTKAIVELIKAWVQLKNGRRVKFVKDGVELEIQGDMGGEQIEKLANVFNSSFKNASNSIYRDGLVMLRARLFLWNREHRRVGATGLDFDRQIRLPNGLIISPDAAYSSDGMKFQLDASFLPDFMAYFLSDTQKLGDTQVILAKCIELGVKLGWLIDPFMKRVYIYRQGKAVQCIDNPEVLTGEDVLGHLSLSMKDFW